MSGPYLAVDCSEDGKCVIALYQEAVQRTMIESRAQGVLHAIDQYLQQEKVEPSALQGLGVVSGSGSFMASRISTSALNGFGFGLGIPVVQLDALPESTGQVAQVFSKVPIDSFAKPRYASEPNVRPNA